MSLEPVNIEGWKWDDIDDANTAKAAADTYFSLPDTSGGDTTDSFIPKPNMNSRGEILFYYVGYSYPSQLGDVLGPTETFDINLEIPD